MVNFIIDYKTSYEFFKKFIHKHNQVGYYYEDRDGHSFPNHNLNVRITDY